MNSHRHTLFTPLRVQYLSSRRSKFRCLLLRVIASLVCLLPISASAKTQCPEGAIRSLAKSWKIDSAAEIRDASCKLWPTDGSKMLVVLAYAPPGHVQYSDGLPFHLALVRLPSLRVLNKYQGKIIEDASQWVGNGYFTIDTAKYELSEGVRAFALREGGFHESGGMDHGAEDNFTLYLLTSDGRIRPVLSIPYMRFWWYEFDQHQGLDKSRATARIGVITIAVQDTMTHGFRDLMATAREEGSNKIIFRQLLQYDGSAYQTKALMEKIYAWWHQ